MRSCGACLLVAIGLTFPLPQPDREIRPARVDAFGDPLPAGALARLGTVRFRHGAATTLAFSPDGKTFAVGGRGLGIRLYDADTGRALANLGADETSFKTGFMSLAFSPDGKTLAAAHGPVRLVEIATGKDLWRVESDSHLAHAVAVSPDGKVIASGDLHGTICLWDRDGGRAIRTFREVAGDCFRLAFSPDGKFLACGGAGAVHVWEVAPGKLRYRLPGRSNYIPMLDFSPDGKELALAWSYEAHVQFRDLRTGEPLRSWEAAEENCFHPTFSPDGKLVATTGSAGVIRLRDRNTGALVRSLRGNDSGGWGMAFSSDGKRLAAITNRSGTVFVWDTTTGKRLSTVAGHDHAVTALTFSRDGRTLFSYGADGRLLSWDWTAGTERFLFRAPSGMTGGASVLGPDAEVLVTHGNDVAHCWDFRNSTDAKDLGRRLMSAWESPPALSVNGHLLAAAQHETAIFVGNPATGEEVRVLKGHDKPASGFTWVSGLAFAPDGRTLASTSADNTVRIWDVPTGKQIRMWETGNGNNLRLAFAPDGKTLAVAEFYWGDGISLWDVASATRLTPPLRHGSCSALAFSADGRFLATGGNDDVLKVWETATGQLVFERKGHHSGVKSLAFSPDGRVLASGGGDSTILVWDLTGRMEGTRLAPLRLSEAEAAALWDALLGPAPKALPAAWRLIAAPGQALPLVKQQLRPASSPPPGRPEKLIADLASDRFAERQAAMRELEEYGELAEGALREALARKPSLEAGRRLEQLLAKCGPGVVPSGERLRAVRALLVLEQIDHPEARAHLLVLSRGAVAARLTREARAALERRAGVR